VNLTGATWRKSSFSGNNGGQCVEIAAVSDLSAGHERMIVVRDSKDPHGPLLALTREDWQSFTAGLRGR
jgi:hypothetical protein